MADATQGSNGNGNGKSPSLTVTVQLATVTAMLAAAIFAWSAWSERLIRVEQATDRVLALEVCVAGMMKDLARLPRIEDKLDAVLVGQKKATP